MKQPLKQSTINPKLCFIIPEYTPETNTHYSHIYQLISELSKDLPVFVLSESGSKVDIPNLAGHITLTPNFLPIRLIIRAYYILLIRFKGYNIFYCHYSNFSALAAGFITLFFGGKTYKWHCAVENHYPKTLKGQWERVLYQLPFLLALKVITGLVTCTPQMKSYYHKHFGLSLPNILLIPNYINLLKFKPSKKSKSYFRKKLVLPERFTLLFVHRLSTRKGANRLVPLAREIANQKLPFQLLVIGEGPLYNTILNDINKYELHKYLLLKGSIPNFRIKNFYFASDILILPSIQEEFGRVQLEAMSLGIPIIGTKTLATPYVLNQIQQTFTVTQKNYLDLISISNQLFSDQKLYHKLVLQGYSQVQNFSLSTIKQNFKTSIMGFK